jgi:dUTP pyrophosphatase
MKLKVYIKYHSQTCKIDSNGMWNDCRSMDNHVIEKDNNELIKLGFSAKLPKYHEANVVPRSGTYKNFKIIQLNHYGVIDGPEKNRTGYSGNDDMWMFNAYALRDTVICSGDRICQFRIQLSSNAPWYAKLRWLFSSGYKFIEVDDLGDVNRGGFGSTGIK